MKPQDRTRAILRSPLDPPLRLILVAIADHMGADDLSWPRVDTIAKETGYAPSTVGEWLAVAERAGILHRVLGEHRAKDCRIEWAALASYTPKATGRGGARGPNIGDHAPNIGPQPPNDGGTEGSEHRRVTPRTSVITPPNIGDHPTEHRTRSVHEASIEAIMEAIMEATTIGPAPAGPPPAAPERVHEPMTGEIAHEPTASRTSVVDRGGSEPREHLGPHDRPEASVDGHPAGPGGDPASEDGAADGNAVSGVAGSSSGGIGVSRADDIAVVWGAYRGRHPTCRPAPPKALRAHIAGRLTDYTAEDVALVIAWAHESRHERAAYLQDHEYLGLDNILRAEKFPVRLELATAWEARGRRDVAVPTVVPFRREGRPTMMDLVREAEAREAAEKARPTRIILEAK